MKLTFLILAAFNELNKPYMWAENGPDYYDCSGLIVEVLNREGFGIRDMNSQRLYDYFSDLGYRECQPEEDCLVFFGKSKDDITHVGLAIGDGWMINAAGAGRNSITMTRDELLEINAKVRLEKISHRRDYVASLKLEYPGGI